MSKLLNLIALGIVGLLVLAATAPVLTRLISALTPLVLAVGIVVAILQLIRYFSRQ